MKNHARAMVLASFVADSLALGAHWIYDTDQIDHHIGKITSLFSPQEGTYHPTKSLGDFTHYGDQSFHLLNYLATRGGTFEISEFCQDFRSLMEGYEGYMDKASKETLKNLKEGQGPDSCGSSSTDLGGPARIAPLIYCFRHNLQEMIQAVSLQTRLTHTGPGVLEGAQFLAVSCYKILNGASLREAIKEAIGETSMVPELHLRISKCLESTATSTRQQVKEFGQMCSITAALPGAIYTALKHEDSLENALIETVMAGGDSAARGMVVGMLLGAALGEENIPSHWLAQLNKHKPIVSSLEKLP